MEKGCNGGSNPPGARFLYYLFVCYFVLLFIPEGLELEVSGKQFRFFPPSWRGDLCLGNCVSTSFIPNAGLDQEFVVRAIDDLLTTGHVEGRTVKSFKKKTRNLDAVHWYNSFNDVAVPFLQALRSAGIDLHRCRFDQQGFLSLRAAMSDQIYLLSLVDLQNPEAGRSVDFSLCTIRSVPYEGRIRTCVAHPTTIQLHTMAYERKV